MFLLLLLPPFVIASSEADSYADCTRQYCFGPLLPSYVVSSRIRCAFGEAELKMITSPLGEDKPKMREGERDTTDVECTMHPQLLIYLVVIVVFMLHSVVRVCAILLTSQR